MKAKTAMTTQGWLRSFARQCQKSVMPRPFRPYQSRWHSGFLASAKDAGANAFKMLEVSHHRSLETVRGYLGSAEMFEDHTWAGFL